MSHKWLLAALPLLAACESAPPTLGAPPANPLGLTAAADFKSVILDDTRYTRTEARSYPLIDSWTYNLPTETKDRWTRRIEFQRFKKVDADEIFSQMHEATANQSRQAHPASRTVCFVTDREDGTVKEANVWRYANVTQGNRTLTYGTGLLWRTTAANFSNGEFNRACHAMRTQQVLAPPPVSTP